MTPGQPIVAKAAAVHQAANTMAARMQPTSWNSRFTVADHEIIVGNLGAVGKHLGEVLYGEARLISIGRSEDYVRPLMTAGRLVGEVTEVLWGTTTQLRKHLRDSGERSHWDDLPVRTKCPIVTHTYNAAAAAEELAKAMWPNPAVVTIPEHYEIVDNLAWVVTHMETALSYEMYLLDSAYENAGNPRLAGPVVAPIASETRKLHTAHQHLMALRTVLFDLRYHPKKEV